MKFYLTMFILLLSFIVNADITRYGKLTSSSNLVTEVLCTDGLEVTSDCSVRFLMGGFKNVGPYLLDGTKLINNDYVKTEVLVNGNNSITNIHIYGDRRININLTIDNKLLSYGTIWIHQPITNNLYTTVYDWHMTITLTNYLSKAGSRNFNVVYVKDYDDELLIMAGDPYSDNDDCGNKYYCSFCEINKRRFFIGSYPLSN